MSNYANIALVDQFHSSVEHLFQQQEALFEGKVRMESQTAETDFWDQLGETTAVKRTSRHQDTPRVDSKHHRRQVVMTDYEWSDLIDKADKVRQLADFENPYAQSAVFALNRAKDDEVIAAATGTAYARKPDDTAMTAYSLPGAQQINVQFGTSPAANIGMNLAKLIEAKHILGEAEIPAGTPLFLALSQQQISDLLNDVDEVSNKDYAAVQALQRGDVDEFMGFRFIKSQRLALASGTGIRTCFAYAMPALLCATAPNTTVRISERDDKSYSTQVFASRSVGATRMQEDGVVEIPCDEVI